ncbi:hypothetical protein HQ346_16890 [Rhodococcus sp. BP-252]|uniref:hypothetical protein n=1 Tax=unclassified Rhodococcus (in: high G+C Gram-positive bacteria) TaxID=192944 RepID=UPI001C9AC00C|nr:MULTISPECIES: hypothetical protein [unclassified Rhodococcus (in: high G+C Gram-positive bacteria)]MBY6413373.1 hypothetical protein [Rhodococcus sp. BP-320]MBY6418023.1 hypothetical protein [Rhodococcus sp. BP-321]MBY6422287.1 hypothetical protein [Rhodococcus sp. BP-324]MBY6428072.1 hypothetical protein [Rhodococcus sp. BP-323]MBY6433294.1 hypothetical protein [Rhodococcus sp. BP-322]
MNAPRATARLRTARRLLLLLVVTLGVVAGSNAVAYAQDPTPPAIPGIADTATEGNDFQKERRECLADNAADRNAFQDFMNDVTGNIVPETFCLTSAFENNPGDAVSTAVSSAASSFWGDPIGDFTKSVMEGNSQAFRTVMTFWMTAGIPGLAADTAMSGLRNIVTGLTVAALFASIVIAMTKLALARKQAVLEGATETANMLVRTVGAVTLLPILVLMFHQLGDVMSAYALDKFVGGDLNEQITAITAFDDKTGLGPVLALACAGFAFLGSVAQLIALLIREAVLCVVVAVIPLSAAASAMGTGRSSYKSMIAFIFGALLFKPVATLLYLFAFWASAASATDQVATVIIGSVLLAVVGFSLPSLVRIVAPAAETIAAGGREVGMLGAAGAAAATGAAGMGSRALGGAARLMGGAAGAGGSSGAAGTGARPSSGFQGRYSGSDSSSNKSHAGASSGPMGAERRVGRAVASAGARTSSAGLRGAAGALRAAGAGARSAGSMATTLGAAADGAIGNYYGRIQR